MLHEVKKKYGVHRYKRNFLALFFLSVLLLFGVWQRHEMSVAYSYLFYPVLMVQHTINTHSNAYYTRQKDIEVLQQQILSLQEECQSVREDNLILQATSAYYDSIAEIMQFKERYNVQGRIFAQIVGKIITDTDHCCFIDAGTHHHVQRNMIALYHNNIIGVVEDVYPLYAKVRLITDKHCKISVSCVATGATGIHRGTNRIDETEISYVSHLSSLMVGDLILSSGEGAIFPQGFGIGTITAYASEGLYHKVTVKPNVTVATIRYCDLIPPHVTVALP